MYIEKLLICCSYFTRTRMHAHAPPPSVPDIWDDNAHSRPRLVAPFSPIPPHSAVLFLAPISVTNPASQRGSFAPISVTLLSKRRSEKFRPEFSVIFTSIERLDFTDKSSLSELRSRLRSGAETLPAATMSQLVLCHAEVNFRQHAPGHVIYLLCDLILVRLT